MQLPYLQHAVITEAKVSDYLLNLQHPDGAGKARLFLAAGFTANRWQDLADALKDLAATWPVTHQIDSIHGRKYIVEGELRTPHGSGVYVRTVWIAEANDPMPRLVTAYPIQRKARP